MTTGITTPNPLASETIASIQASTAALLGTASVTLNNSGQPRVPLFAVGPFYRALAAYPAGVQYLLDAAAGAARAAMKRGLPATAQHNGLTVLAFPLPIGSNGANGTASGAQKSPQGTGTAPPAAAPISGAALVAFTTPGVRSDLRPALAADLGLPPGAIPAESEPLDQERVSATLRLLEQTVALASGAAVAAASTTAAAASGTAGARGTAVARGTTGARSGGEPEVRRDRILYSATKALFKALHEDDVLRIVSETLAGLLHMDHAVPYLLGQSGWEPHSGVSYWGELDTAPAPLSLESEQAATLQRGEVVTISDSIRRAKKRLLVPLLLVTPESRDLAGVVVLETAHATQPDSAAERDLALLIARQAALALHNVRTAMRDRTLARTLQETLQSHFDPEVVPHLIVEEFYQAAARDSQVGGDFYDVFTLPDKRVAVLVGDVAGKGLDSAIHTTLARYTLRAYALLASDPAEIVRLTNEALARFREFKDFLTMALVILDPDAGQLHYASAGHPPIFLYRRPADAIGSLESTGTLLGMMPGLTWESHTHKWGPGDMLLLYTDGISEAHAPGSMDLFETTRIRDLFASHRKAPPREMIDAIFHAVDEFSGGVMHDDCAMLVVTQAE